MSISSIAKTMKDGLFGTLAAVAGLIPAFAQQAEIDVARAAVAEGATPEQAIEGQGKSKKDLVMFFIAAFLGETRMRIFGPLIGLLVDVIVARLKRSGEIRKPTAEELADVHVSTDAVRVVGAG